MTREQFIILFETHVDPGLWHFYPKDVQQIWQELSHHFEYQHTSQKYEGDGLFCDDVYDVFTEHDSNSEEESEEYIK